MRLKAIGIATLALALAPAAQAGVFTCMKDGKKVYSDKPCQDVTRPNSKTIIDEVTAKSAQMQKDRQAETEMALRAAREAKTGQSRGKASSGTPVAESMSTVNAMQIASGMGIATGLKLSILQHYLESGEMPKDNAAMGQPPPPEWHTKALNSVEIKDGAITLVFNQSSGVEGGILRLVPDLSRPHIGVEWNCVTPSYPAIKTIMPDCEFDKNG